MTAHQNHSHPDRVLPRFAILCLLPRIQVSIYILLLLPVFEEIRPVDVCKSVYNTFGEFTSFQGSFCNYVTKDS